MKTEKFDAWIKRILTTEDEEISCSECFDSLSGYVEVEISHEPIQEGYLKVKQHLDQCQVCQEEHEMLLNLARMEAEQGGSSPKG